MGRPARGTRTPRPPGETRTLLTIGGVLAMRILGISLVLPVVALHAATLTDDVLLIGLAAGGYGVTMALLQVPFGLLSDRWGRKPVLTLGMSLFAVGSLAAYAAPTGPLLVAARLLQGAGAVSSAAMALVADVTPMGRRATGMAIIGAPIGIAFGVGLVAGPVLTRLVGVPGLFLLTGGLALVAVVAIQFALDEPTTRAREPGRLRDVLPALRDRDLLKVDAVGFSANFALTGFFVSMQLTATRTLGMDAGDLWKVTLPMAAFGGVAMFAASRAADVGHLRAASVTAALLTLAGPVLVVAPVAWVGVAGVIGGGLLFFAGFSILEALLPTLVTGLASEGKRGLNVGSYNTFQFLGNALGGLAGAVLLARPGVFTAVLVGLAGVAAWALLTVREVHGAPSHGAPSAAVAE